MNEVYPKIKMHKFDDATSNERFEILPMNFQRFRDEHTRTSFTCRMKSLWRQKRSQWIIKYILLTDLGEYRN